MSKLLQFLLPRAPQFYSHFEDSAQNVLKGVQLLNQMVHSEVHLRDQLLDRMEEIEHRGDEITHNIFNELGKTFITPIDREDIHDIASNMDDIIDLVFGAALSMKLYRVMEFPTEVYELIDVIEEAVKHLVTALPLLSNMNQMEKIQEACVAINSCENIADGIFHRAIAKLFDENTDPIAIIKMKEILANLETATDKCEDVANLLENVIIKYA